MKENIDMLTDEKWMQLSRDEILMGFMAQCIEAAALADGSDYLSMLHRLEHADMTEGYILRHYDVLHTESIEHITEDILTLLKKRESSQKNKENV